MEGKFPPKQVVYRDPIGRDRHDHRKRRVDSHGGKPAQTQVRHLKAGAGQSLVACRLATGRTHQIRVHLSYHGYPLVGDPLYHPQPQGRLMLHAHRLSFVHPFLQKTVDLEAKSPSFEARLTFALSV